MIVFAEISREINGVTSSRAVAQIILARVLDLRYKDGKDNNQGVLP
jgi:hypothetical protein